MARKPKQKTITQQREDAMRYAHMILCNMRDGYILIRPLGSEVVIWPKDEAAKAALALYNSLAGIRENA